MDYTKDYRDRSFSEAYGMGMGRKIWLTTLLGALLGAGIGAALGNITVGIVYGVFAGVALGFWMDRRIRTRPPVG